jgi:hypothetical protein
MASAIVLTPTNALDVSCPSLGSGWPITATRQHDRGELGLKVDVAVTGYGEQQVTLDQVWGAIDAIVSRRELRAAVDAAADMVPPHEADQRKPTATPAPNADKSKASPAPSCRIHNRRTPQNPLATERCHQSGSAVRYG